MYSPGNLPSTGPGSPATPRLRRSSRAPIVTLLLLAPIVGEVLSGATRLSYIFVIVPEIMVWGCGALMIREAVRHWRGGWRSMLLLGIALAVAEEIIIQQTSLAPYAWAGANQVYGRRLGVNWLWLLSMLGYESVWVVLVPVQLTELIFPDQRDAPWMRGRGFLAAGVTFVLGSIIAWYAWTQRARPVVFHVPKYQPPLAYLLLGVAAIVLLIIAAYGLRGSAPRHATSVNPAPRPWLVGLLAFICSIAWYGLMGIAFGANPSLPFTIPLAGGIVWACMVFLLIEHWSVRAGWGDPHRLALVIGAIVACMAGGFSGSGLWPRIDLIGKVVFNLIAVILLGCLALRQARSLRATIRQT